MKLSLVIPVWNDRAGLDRLLEQLAGTDHFHEIIISDDASDRPIRLDEFPVAASFGNRLRLLRSKTRGGAGRARNLALPHVTGSHVMFFDADDSLGPDFPEILAAARGQSFDFLIFRHHDSRILAKGGSGSFPAEEARWRQVGAGFGLTALDRDQAAILCRTSAYPWNKIYDVGFLRREAIGCTEIMVHNDIELHMASFLCAGRILATALIGAEHVVTAGGGRLSNRRDAERLEIFRAFAPVIGRLRLLPPEDLIRFAGPILGFICDLIGWVGDNLDSAHQDRLRARASNFLLDELDGEMMTLTAMQDPHLADRVVRIIREGAAA